MPDPLRLGAAARADIAAQISARLYRPRTTFALEAADRLGDSLRVMLLTVEAARRPTGTLEDRLIDTGQWHHQLLRANLATAFARSVAVDPAVPQERQQVVELARSDLPQAVEDGLARAMTAVPPDADAKLIVAPSYQLSALWLTGAATDQVLIIAAPDVLAPLEAGQQFAGAQFVNRMAAATPIPGLGAPPRMQEPV
jgi:hypothetical protein